MPLAVLSSPYVIFQVLPSTSFQVELFVGSKAECLPSLTSSGRRVLYTHVSADPVSKFSLMGCGGVPIETSAMYRELCSTSSALILGLVSVHIDVGALESRKTYRDCASASGLCIPLHQLKLVSQDLAAVVCEDALNV
jgi:hypothetical protein